MTLKTRKPTNAPSWPLILLAGEAKTGKTYRAAEFTGDERVGRSFFLDLGEGSADEYGAVPGADYEIIEHDGTWIDIIAQVEAVRDVAREALDKGEKPVSLTIDSMTAEWSMLCAWTDTRARRSVNNQKQLAANPDAEIDITSNYWNDANSRHNRLMNILKTFPGIVIMTALETEKTQFGANGRPITGAPKVARPDGQKRLTADATVWVRLSLDSNPTIVGIRSLKHNITPGKDHPEPWADFTLAKLVFEFMGLGDGAQVRNAPVLDADQVDPTEEPAAAQAAKPVAKASPLAAARNEVTVAGEAIGWDFTKMAASYAEYHGGELANVTDVSELNVFRNYLRDLKNKPATPAGPVVAAVSDGGQLQAYTQIENYAKATQLDRDAVFAHYQATNGHLIGKGSESNLRKFLVALKAHGLPTTEQAAA